MSVFICTDHESPEEEVVADSAVNAAMEWADGGDWNHTETLFLAVSVRPEGGDEDDWESVLVTLDPDEPDCVDDKGHEWRSPHALVGGIESNPGIQGHGGGVISTEICVHCGLLRREDSWATDPITGQQGLTSTSYDSESTLLGDYLEELKVDDLPQEDVDQGVDHLGQEWRVFLAHDEDVSGRWAACESSQVHDYHELFLTKDDAATKARAWAEELLNNGVQDGVS